MTTTEHVQVIPRRSNERGHADHGWLKAFHTFSVAGYHDPAHTSYGVLRVINEDRFESGTGFGMHRHEQFEIFSYLVGGQLEHQDSMGNTEILSRGALQSTSTGTGISHSEKAYGPQQVHLLQIWASPRTGEGHKEPAYFTRTFADEDKHNKFALVVAPDNSPLVVLQREAKGPVPVRSELWMHASIIDPGVSLVHTPIGKEQGEKKGYIHVIQKSGYNPGTPSGATIRVGSSKSDGDGSAEHVELREGDGAYLSYPKGADLEVSNVGEGTAEVVLFDLE